MAKVVLDHVVKKFDSVTAVNDLSITIQDKEFLVLVGPSGCGKSTALRLIAGLEEVSSGHIYIGDRLVNFVASFIGSPAMNFFKVWVNVSDGQAEVKRDNFSVMLSGERGRALTPYSGRMVVLGIRPEHLGVVGGVDGEESGKLQATVEVVEMMGSEEYVYFDMGAESFVARLDVGVGVRVGDRVRLSYSKEQVHLFDPDTERNILLALESSRAAG